jgi:hypothetical protein
MSSLLNPCQASDPGDYFVAGRASGFVERDEPILQEDTDRAVPGGPAVLLVSIFLVEND